MNYVLIGIKWTIKADQSSRLEELYEWLFNSKLVRGLALIFATIFEEVGGCWSCSKHKAKQCGHPWTYFMVIYKLLYPPTYKLYMSNGKGPTKFHNNEHIWKWSLHIPLEILQMIINLNMNPNHLSTWEGIWDLLQSCIYQVNHVGFPLYLGDPNCWLELSFTQLQQAVMEVATNASLCVLKEDGGD